MRGPNNGPESLVTMAKMALRDRPRVYLDLETTGLNPANHEIIEIGFVRDDGFSWHIKIHPEHPETAEPKALEVNGYTPEEWETQGATCLILALRQLRVFLEDCVIVGHNVAFDVAFLEEAFRKASDKPWHAYYAIDTTTLAYEHLVPLGLKSVSLKHVCEFLGLSPEPDQHRALAGAETCRKVYQKLARAGWLQRLWWGLSY